MRVKVVLGKSHGVPAGRAPRPQPRALILLPTADVTPATSSPSIPGRDRLAEVPSAALRPERPRSFISADGRRAPAGWVARHREGWSVVSVCFHRLGSSSTWPEAGRGCNAAPGSASRVDRHRDDHHGVLRPPPKGHLLADPDERNGERRLRHCNRSTPLGRSVDPACVCGRGTRFHDIAVGLPVEGRKSTKCANLPTSKALCHVGDIPSDLAGSVLRWYLPDRTRGKRLPETFSSRTTANVSNIAKKGDPLYRRNSRQNTVGDL